MTDPAVVLLTVTAVDHGAVTLSNAEIIPFAVSDQVYALVNAFATNDVNPARFGVITMAALDTHATFLQGATVVATPEIVSAVANFMIRWHETEMIGLAAPGDES